MDSETLSDKMLYLLKPIPAMASAVGIFSVGVFAQSSLDPTTSVPLGWVGGGFAVVASGAWWLSSKLTKICDAITSMRNRFEEHVDEGNRTMLAIEKRLNSVEKNCIAHKLLEKRKE